MNNFNFYNPVSVFFGKNTIAELANILPENEKIMLLYGGGSIRLNGVYEQVTQALKGFDYVEFGGIEPNPSYETMMEAYEIAKSENVTFLLPVGGGSVIDGCKFLAAALCLPQGVEPWGILQGTVSVKEAMPLGCVLTLPATGSEMNGNSVISRKITREKLSFGTSLVMPKFSILDPQVCFSLPKKQIANGIVDAFIHVMEQYLTIPNNTPLQDLWAEGILRVLIDEAPKVMAEQANYDSMANFMWSATMALNGIISRGAIEDWSTHTIGHELTALYGIDHARTLAVALPGNMNIRRKVKGEKIMQYGERIWGITTGTSDEKIDKTIEKTVEFFESLDVPTRLSAYNLGKETCVEVAQRLAARGVVNFGEAGDITQEIVEKILEDRL